MAIDTSTSELRYGQRSKVEFFVVQAPLFSTNPRIGTKLRWLNLYHTALVLQQQLPGRDPDQGWGVQWRKAWEHEFNIFKLLGGLEHLDDFPK